MATEQAAGDLMVNRDKALTPLDFQASSGCIKGKKY